MACFSGWTQPPEFLFSATVKQNRPIRLLGCGRATKIHTFPSNRSFPSSGGPGVSTRTLSLAVPRHYRRSIAPRTLGFVSLRQAGSEFPFSLCLYEKECNFVESTLGEAF